jgi:thymidylate synthase
VDYDFDPNKVPDDLTFDNFVLKDYNPQPAIKAPMAV